MTFESLSKALGIKSFSSCTSHSGPSKLDSDRVMEPVERVNRSNSDGSIAHRGAFNHCTIGSLTHRKSLDQGLIMTHNDHVTPQELKTSIQEKLHERIQNQVRKFGVAARSVASSVTC